VRVKTFRCRITGVSQMPLAPPPGAVALLPQHRAPRRELGREAGLAGPFSGEQAPGLMRIKTGGHHSTRRRAHVRRGVVRLERDAGALQPSDIRQQRIELLRLRKPLRGPHLVDDDHQDIGLVATGHRGFTRTPLTKELVSAESHRRRTGRDPRTCQHRPPIHPSHPSNLAVSTTSDD
jgi:hypothetical protein